MVKRSYNAVVERNVEWQGTFASEPYEAGWSSEAPRKGPPSMTTPLFSRYAIMNRF